eukprot:gene9782-biopygen7715
MIPWGTPNTAPSCTCARNMVIPFAPPPVRRSYFEGGVPTQTHCSLFCEQRYPAPLAPHADQLEKNLRDNALLQALELPVLPRKRLSA